jgi:hypothetical protein
LSPNASDLFNNLPAPHGDRDPADAKTDERVIVLVQAGGWCGMSEAEEDFFEMANLSNITRPGPKAAMQVSI